MLQMKLVTLNDSIVGIFVRATEDTENNTLRTEQGNTALADSDTVEIISLTEDELETVKEYVDDIANGAQVSAFFEVSDGSLSKNLEAILIDVREERDRLLEESDKESKAIYNDVWSLMTDEDKEPWVVYRQALRDFPNTVDEVLENIQEYDWPNKPA